MSGNEAVVAAIQELKDFLSPVVELAAKQIEWMKAEEARSAAYGRPHDDRPAQSAESPAPATPTTPPAPAADPPKDEGSGEATGG